MKAKSFLTVAFGSKLEGQLPFWAALPLCICTIWPPPPVEFPEPEPSDARLTPTEPGGGPQLPPEPEFWPASTDDTEGRVVIEDLIVVLLFGLKARLQIAGGRVILLAQLVLRLPMGSELRAQFLQVSLEPWARFAHFLHNHRRRDGRLLLLLLLLPGRTTTARRFVRSVQRCAVARAGPKMLDDAVDMVEAEEVDVSAVVVVVVVVSLVPPPDVMVAVVVVRVDTEEANASVAHSLAIAERFACSAAFLRRFFLPERPPPLFGSVCAGAPPPLSLVPTPVPPPHAPCRSWFTTWPFCLPPTDGLPLPGVTPAVSVGLLDRFVADDNEEDVDDDDDAELPVLLGASLSPQSLRVWDAAPGPSFDSFSRAVDPPPFRLFRCFREPPAWWCKPPFIAPPVADELPPLLTCPFACGVETAVLLLLLDDL
uniref:Uncharacterized protein n=1 Tax=Anopheles atroparvus TaxID=41427 RepID=A0A182JG73_ANOAO